jgi:hypothetical protein
MMVDTGALIREKIAILSQRQHVGKEFVAGICLAATDKNRMIFYQPGDIVAISDIYNEWQNFIAPLVAIGLEYEQIKEALKQIH